MMHVAHFFIRKVVSVHLPYQLYMLVLISPHPHQNTCLTSYKRVLLCWCCFLGMCQTRENYLAMSHLWCLGDLGSSETKGWRSRAHPEACCGWRAPQGWNTHWARCPFTSSLAVRCPKRGSSTTRPHPSRALGRPAHLWNVGFLGKALWPWKPALPNIITP